VLYVREELAVADISTLYFVLITVAVVTAIYVVSLVVWSINLKSAKMIDQRSERRRNLAIEMADRGYVQKAILAYEGPARDWPYQGTVRRWDTAWVPRDDLTTMPSEIQLESFNDLFARMATVVGVQIGKDTWQESIDKVNRHSQEVKDMRRIVLDLQKELDAREENHAQPKAS
jgi:hypothetical protein